MRGVQEPCSRVRSELKTKSESIDHKGLHTVTKKIKNYIFKLCDVIGKGSFSTVYKGYEEDTEEPVAIKVVQLDRIQSPTLLKLLHSEVDILKSMKHPNILRCYDVYFSATNCYIITEFCAGGDIRSILASKGPFDQPTSSKVVLGIYEGLKYLGREHIVHRDLKTANVFVKDGQPKIADFGFSKRIHETFRDINIGSPLCMSPEGIIDNIYGPKTDIWALGIFLFEMFHMDSPFGFCKTQQELKDVISKPLKFQILNQSLSSQLRDLIMNCLEINREHRISIEEIEHCAYMRKLRQSLQNIDLLVSQVEEYRLDVYDSIVSTEVPIPTERTRIVSHKAMFDDVEQIRLEPKERVSVYAKLTNFHINVVSPKEVRNPKWFLGEKKEEACESKRLAQNESPDKSLNEHERKLTMFSTKKVEKKKFNNTICNPGWTREISPPKFQALASPRMTLIKGLCNFEDTLSLLHYCRVLFKTIKQCERHVFRKLEYLGSWLFKILDEILVNINKMKHPNEKVLQLKDIISEYNHKYHSELPSTYKPNLTISFIQSLILDILKELEDCYDSSNECLVSTISYLIFVYDLNEILRKSTSSQNHSHFTEHNGIEEFLSVRESKSKHLKTFTR